ncbi:Helix-turn-helix domain-containing protein [Gammaproteobacteria bacterium]
MSILSSLISEIGLQSFASQAGVTYQAVRKWERAGVPAERVLPIVRATQGRVTPYELRPDLYPDPDWMPPGLDRG